MPQEKNRVSELFAGSAKNRIIHVLFILFLVPGNAPKSLTYAFHKLYQPHHYQNVKFYKNNSSQSCCLQNIYIQLLTLILQMSFNNF